MSPSPTPPGNVDVLGGPFQKQKEDGAQRSRILWPGEYIQVLDAGKPILAENKPQHKEKQVVRIMRAEDYHKPFPSPVPVNIQGDRDRKHKPVVPTPQTPGVPEQLAGLQKDIQELKEMLSEANRSLRHADRLIQKLENKVERMAPAKPVKPLPSTSSWTRDPGPQFIQRSR